MGMVHANVLIRNGDDITLTRQHLKGEDEIRQIEVKMLVDSGAIMLTINEEIKEALGLPIVGKRISQMANGQIIELPVAGNIEVRFEDRFCLTNALVLPDDSEPLLGAIPMEEMDLWISPARNLLTPVHPEGPVMSLK